MMSLPASSLLLALWLLASNVIFVSIEAAETSAEDLSPQSACLNCSLCGLCTPNTPPPPDYTQYVPPPPPYYTQYVPPPPPAQAECPPSTSVPCCDSSYPPPSPSTYLPYYNYSASPPSQLSGRAFSYVFGGSSILLFFSGAIV